MKLEHLLECPSCGGHLTRAGQEFMCSECKKLYPVVNEIPRFVPPKNYADSFGFQWNKFDKTQIDSSVQTNRSKNRFLEETLLNSELLDNRLVLDAGCGAGRFSEIALDLGARLVAVDFSSAVDAAQRNLKSEKLLVVQADLSQLPIKSNSMDYIYCIGVLQHTENPEAIITELIRCLKFNGELTLTFYEDSSWHVKLYSKYLVRPITKRIPQKLLFGMLVKTSVVWFPVTSWLFKLPQPLSRIFRFMIPIANYVEYTYHSKEDALNEAVLDTFDMLSPAYDRPIKKSKILKWVTASGFEMVQISHKPKFGTMRFVKNQSRLTN
jgi:ubiquinone/menaquinone biosynthesis C-methylase UbiE